MAEGSATWGRQLRSFDLNWVGDHDRRARGRKKNLAKKHAVLLPRLKNKYTSHATTFITSAMNDEEAS